MMSAPDRVQVDHAGAHGSGRIASTVGTDPSLAMAPAPAAEPPEVARRSTPWTIGSTETVALLEHLNNNMSTAAAAAAAGYPGEGEGALVDQAGVRRATPSPPPASFRAAADGGPTGMAVGGGVAIGAGGEATSLQGLTANMQQSHFQHRLVHQASTSAAVEAVLTASCDVMGFDIAEVWLRTGLKTHQLINSHLRPCALEDTVRDELMDVYYGERSSERTHRLSPALCKRAKEAMDVVWVTAHTLHGAEALKLSISDVRTAVAVPVCHEESNTNLTVIFFSIRRIIMKPPSVEFLVHMSLATGIASVNALADESDRDITMKEDSIINAMMMMVPKAMSQSEHIPSSAPMLRPNIFSARVSVTGAKLDLQWKALRNVEYLTDGGNSWIHTAILDGKPVVIKTLKPECQDLALAINEIESELAVHSRLHDPNICALLGAGTTTKGVRFIVMERLDGGTLTQMLGYDTRIRDRRKRFWRKKQMSYLDVLQCARSIASAMEYCQVKAIPGSMVLHRDLKPDNIGFTLNGQVKVIDFGLAKIVDNASAMSDEVYIMSGETGSLRYMAPEVADSLPYNHKADVYSFGIILWEMNSCKKPFDGLNRDAFYERIVHGGERPPLNKKWPEELKTLMNECWNPNFNARPTFSEIVARLDSMISKEKGGGGSAKKTIRKLTGIIDRHSTWF